MTRKRKLLIVAIVLGFITLAAVCVPYFIPDRDTAGRKALLRNLKPLSQETKTNVFK